MLLLPFYRRPPLRRHRAPLWWRRLLETCLRSVHCWQQWRRSLPYPQRMTRLEVPYPQRRGQPSATHQHWPSPPPPRGRASTLLRTPAARHALPMVPPWSARRRRRLKRARAQPQGSWRRRKRARRARQLPPRLSAGLLLRCSVLPAPSHPPLRLSTRSLRSPAPHPTARPPPMPLLLLTPRLRAPQHRRHLLRRPRPPPAPRLAPQRLLIRASRRPLLPPPPPRPPLLPSPGAP